MLSTVPPAPITRSSLEEMLDSIRRRDEQPKDVPPALPVRPTSRARLPSSRRSLPINFKIGDKLPEYLPNESGDSEEKKVVQTEEKEQRSEVFESKKLSKIESPAESPYIRMVETENYEQRLEEMKDVPSSSPLSMEERRWGDNIGYILKKRLKVWCRLPNAQWELGKIQSLSGEDALILLSDGRVATLCTENILPANPDILDGVDDLVQLSYLNEPSVLHNLRHRYSRDEIYTKAGPVLVAINPFKEVPLYGDEFVSAYRHKLKDSPHVYAVADTAFNEMMRDGVNQSIIISGESGAGKTETAKIAMQYLAALCGGGGIEYEILQTNPILEAFGNAKTSRNDNSSRFGKLIDIHFSATGKICGAKIQTFLLEKSRVVQRAMGERSYHIFYQLCAGAPSALKERLNLKAANEYEYLKQSDCLTIDDVDDAQRFHLLMEALEIVQICKEDQENAFAMLAAVLWLGNISFSVMDNENHVEVATDEAVTSAAKLMGCNIEDLMLALSTRNIRAGNDNIVQKLTLPQAIDTRDALAKYLYASLFSWLVEQINKSLEVGKRRTGRSISILDIYGFESFDKNSFEQFCINYANERLQQHFNRHLFKLEQEEYSKDGIDWKKVDFEDNQECLNLFEKKPLGLLSLLDEESTFPQGTDLTFAHKLQQHLNANPCFKGERGGAFTIHHYAGEVLYDTSGFLEKNRDPLHCASIHLLSSCSSLLPQLFGENMLNQSQVPASPLRRLSGADFQKQSVGLKFKGQLFKLMQQLENTTPHFIRCIKPNGKQLPGIYKKDLVLQQLRCCGVLEVVRISRSGYPTRMTHQQFATRYDFLLLENVASEDPLSVSVAILQQFNILPDMYQVGYTKLFFRTGQIGALEDSRNRTLRGILGVQKRFRGHQARCYFQNLKKGMIILQSLVRGECARKEFEFLVKRRRAVILIQRHMKQRITKKVFEQHRKAIILLQSVFRGWLVRRHFEKNLEESNSKLIEVENSGYMKLQEAKDSKPEHIQMLPPVLAELHMRVMNAEAALRQKEEENATLQKQLQQYDRRWLEYEAKMKSMEETWQKQFTSLQMSIATAKNTLANDDLVGHTGMPDSSPGLHYYDSEDGFSAGSRTPDGIPARAPNRSSDVGLIITTDSDVGHNPVGHLVKEFEQQTQVFDDDAGFLIEVKSRQQISEINPDEELRKLKSRFAMWKKEFKVRLRETKAALQKLGNPETERSRKKWWGMRSTRGT